MGWVAWPNWRVRFLATALSLCGGSNDVWELDDTLTVTVSVVRRQLDGPQ